MPGSPRERLESRAGVIAVALVVTVVVGVGAVIVHRGSPAPAPPGPTPTPTGTIAPAASIMPVQRLTGAASTFTATAGGWTGKHATVASVASPTYAGPGALRISDTTAAAPPPPPSTPTTGTTSPADFAVTPTPGPTSSAPPATPPVASVSTGAMAAWSPREAAHGGDRYVATAYVRAITASRGIQAELRFINAAGKVTDTEIGQPLNDSMTKWQQLAPVVGISPKGTAQVQLGVVLPVVGDGAQHLVDSATIAQTPGGSTNVVGPLTVRGNQILQGNGIPLIMRGIQRFGLEGGTNNPLPTDAEIGQLKLWGANEVRLSLGEQKWLSTSCHYVANYPEIVDKVVHSVTSRGMVAMINLHFSSLSPCGKPGLTPMADNPGSITFWQEVATRYKNNPLVVFDLFNEPHVPQAVWLDGGTFTNNGVQVAAVGMQQLYETVRGTGAVNLVVISGLDYADHPPTTLVDGVNIAYGAHAYQCENGPPPLCKTPHPYDASIPLHHWATFAKTTPVIVTEFGWPANNDGTYNGNVVKYAEAHRWGWDAFAWDGSTGGLFDLVDAHPASDGTTIEPNNSAMPLVAGFALNTLAHPLR